MRKTSAQIGQTTKHRKEPGTVEKNFSRTEVLNGLPMFWLIPLLNWEVALATFAYWTALLLRKNDNYSTNKPLACFLNMEQQLNQQDIDRIIEMAWEDRTPFEAIKQQFGLDEGSTIQLMRKEMKSSSFRMWRARVQSRNTKHLKKRDEDVDRFKCTLQRAITMNKISKR